jgi:hypothetical protein
MIIKRTSTRPELISSDRIPTGGWQYSRIADLSLATGGGFDSQNEHFIEYRCGVWRSDDHLPF